MKPSFSLIFLDRGRGVGLRKKILRNLIYASPLTSYDFKEAKKARSADIKTKTNKIGETVYQKI